MGPQRDLLANKSTASPASTIREGAKDKGAAANIHIDALPLVSKRFIKFHDISQGPVQ